jgi:DNA-binding transcriptional LysR family regulator
MSLKQLLHAVTLADAGSYGDAARALELTQPALSRSIQALEKRLGARLFDRGRSGVEPTDVGRLLLERGRALLAEASELEREVGLAIGLEIGTLRVGAAPYPAEISVGSACGQLLARHPNLELDVQVGDWQFLTQLILDGRLDVAVAELSVARDDERLITEDLPRHKGLMFVRAGHPLAGKTSPDLTEVLEYPLVSSSLPKRVRSLGPPVRVDTLPLMRRIVIESDAVGLATPGQISHDIEAGTIVRLGIDLPWLHTDYGLIRLRRRTPSPATLVFMELMRQVERQLAQTEIAA